MEIELRFTSSPDRGNREMAANFESGPLFSAREMHLLDQRIEAG